MCGGARAAQSLSEEFRSRIEKRLESIFKENQKYERLVVSRDEALAMFQENKFKVRGSARVGGKHCVAVPPEGGRAVPLRSSQAHALPRSRTSEQAVGSTWASSTRRALAALEGDGTLWLPGAWRSATQCSAATAWQGRCSCCCSSGRGRGRSIAMDTGRGAERAKRPSRLAWLAWQRLRQGGTWCRGTWRLWHAVGVQQQRQLHQRHGGSGRCGANGLRSSGGGGPVQQRGVAGQERAAAAAASAQQRLGRGAGAQRRPGAPERAAWVTPLRVAAQIEIISALPATATISIYRVGPMVDLCTGPHLPNTGYFKAAAVTNTSRCAARLQGG